MKLIKKVINERGITRLCHMTQTNKLLHILKNPDGIIVELSIFVQSLNPQN